jgi:hypothetical protein
MNVPWISATPAGRIEWSPTAHVREAWCAVCDHSATGDGADALLKVFPRKHVRPEFVVGGADH